MHASEIFKSKTINVAVYCLHKGRILERKQAATLANFTAKCCTHFICF
jgi:hypothetical protein